MADQPSYERVDHAPGADRLGKRVPHPDPVTYIKRRLASRRIARRVTGRTR